MEKLWKSLAGWVARICIEEQGQDLVEYALLLAFIALAAVGLLSGVRTDVKGLWSSVNSALSSASTTAS